MVGNFEHRRPAERAEEFLSNFLQPNLPDGTRLPSTRFIAKKLGISEGTVRNVLQKWRKEGLLYGRAGSGIFATQKDRRHTRIHIGTNGGILEPSQFNGYAGKVLLHAFHATMKLGLGASLASLFSKEEYLTPPSAAEVDHRCASLDAMLISLSTFHADTIVQHCHKHGKPFVTFNAPHENATVNFVSPNHTAAFYRAGEALKTCGRTHFALLIFPSIARSMAIRQRIAGLVNSLGTDLGKNVSLRIVPCESWTEEAGAAAVATLIEEGYQPDAVLTSGDQLALGAMRHLRSRGLQVPKDVSIIFGGKVDQKNAFSNVTRMDLPAEEVGQQAVAMLMEMFAQKTHVLPGRYLEIPILPRSTTTESENASLSTSPTPDPLI